MSEADSKPPKADAGSGTSGSGPEAVGDALRSAVEKTLAATAESATGTREKAQGLLDDVVRRGQSAREEVARRGESATSRLADAIGELRAADRESIERLDRRLAAIERRLADLEGAKPAKAADSNPQDEPESRPSKPHGKGESG